ncbi:MAG: 50S ribosomal protein L5 [Planctomycetes bacterium]|nr:50S ribosomal protein L5 [Planctomycetota bacterium]
MARLLDKYRNEVVPALKEALKRDNPLGLPRIEKIVVSMGVGKAIENKNRLDAAARDLGQITGQKAAICRARKSVAGFKLRKGQPIGVKVTLRGRRAYEFLDRLITIVIPRIRDFRGLSPTAFDEAGNYNLGIAEQAVFPEINLDKMEFVQGMNVSIGVKARHPGESFDLLKRLGMPFRQDQAKSAEGKATEAKAVSASAG